MRLFPSHRTFAGRMAACNDAAFDHHMAGLQKCCRRPDEFRRSNPNIKERRDCVRSAFRGLEGAILA